ncbi:hypothetical protein L3X38_007742 [Prunus dulcis]|uniref:Transposable element protein n=1 Tax=Prunus dulcis TaxID=3755 RepID=A0AAD4ZV54_PRUDU|nr:hypothetical protein L3X38_007742 [Prunus dulcis]
MSLSNERFMKEELINLRMKEGGNLTEHVNTFDMCIAGLQKVDVVYSTEDVAMMLWAPLPPSYEHFRKMLMIGKIILNFEEVVQDLVHHRLAQNFGDSSQVKIKMQDGVVGSLTEVRNVLALRKNHISYGALDRERVFIQGQRMEALSHTRFGGEYEGEDLT